MKQSIKQLAFDETIALGFEVLSISNVEARSRVNLKAPHRASFYIIYWFQQGSPLHIVDFNPVTIQPDSFLFVRKDAVQLFDQERHFNSRVILFTEDFFCRSEEDHRLLEASALFNNFEAPDNYFNITAVSALKEQWMLMERESAREPDGFQAPLLQRFLSSFLMLCEREIRNADEPFALPGPRAQLAMAFSKQLETNFRQEKTISYYADKLFVSDKVLTQTLQSFTGKSPKQLINERVLLEAKRLLIHNAESAKSIALHLGFDEPTNFNKFFKKHAGTTPAKFRLMFVKNPAVGKVSS